MPSYSNDLLATLTITVLEPAPTGFNAELASDGQSVELSWTHSGYGKHYQIASRNHSDDDWTYVEANEPSPSETERAVTLGKPQCGVTNYQIRARRPDGVWGSPASDSVTRYCDPPSAPTGLNARTTSESAIDLIWSFSGDASRVSDYRVEYQVLPAAPDDTWTVWPHVEKYSGNAVRLRGLTCNTNYRLRLSLLGDGDVYDGQEWSGTSNTIEPTTDVCRAQGTNTITEKTFTLKIGGLVHGAATLRITWRPVMEEIAGVPHTNVSVISHGLLVTIADDLYARQWFIEGQARNEVYSNDNIWNYYVYDKTIRYDPPIRNVVPPTTTWGRLDSTAPNLSETVTGEIALQYVESIDDIEVDAISDIEYFPDASHNLGQKHRFICQAALHNLSAGSSSPLDCIGSALTVGSNPVIPVR